MPNWTSNRIYVEGEPANVRAFLEAIKWQDKILDFNRVIPMPDFLRRTVSGFMTINGEKVNTWIEDADAEGNPVARCFTDEEKERLLEIGYSSWYDWAIRHWGTKWNACKAEIDDSSEHGYVEITFNTARDAPMPVSRKIVADFPKLTFDCRWRHEDDSPYPHSLEDAA